VPFGVTTLEQLTEHGADAAVWRRLGRDGEQTLTDALDNPDGHDLYRDQEARADAEDTRRRAAQREAERLVCKRCGRKFTNQRWEETTAHRTVWKAGNLSVCGTWHAYDVAREEAAAHVARLQAAAARRQTAQRDRSRSHRTAGTCGRAVGPSPRPWGWSLSCRPAR
jgi:hypothetical protein